MMSGTASARCEACRAVLSKPLVCALCKKRQFCSKDCQVKDWAAGHRRECPGKKVKTPAGDGAPPEDMVMAEVRISIENRASTFQALLSHA
jgi:hypothetical protein